MMLCVPALLLLMARQESQDTASLIYTGVPISSSGSAVQMATHNANVSLSKSRYTVDSLTYLKNLSAQPTTVTISIPVMGKNVDWGMTDNLQVTVMVDNAPVTVTNMGAHMVNTTDPRKMASGIRADSYSNS